VVGEAPEFSTLVQCADENDREQDKGLKAFFESDPRWILDGNRLTLSNDSVEVTLQRDSASPGSS